MGGRGGGGGAFFYSLPHLLPDPDTLPGFNPPPVGSGYLAVGATCFATGSYRALNPAAFSLNYIYAAPAISLTAILVLVLQLTLIRRVLYRLPRLRATLMIHWLEREAFEENGRQVD